MRSFAIPLLLTTTSFISTLAFPSFAQDAEMFSRDIDALKGKPVPDYFIKAPPRQPQPQSGSKQIPDAAHPFKKPGKNDIRGPCPGLNTMANHGYLPRNGIVNYADIISACVEAFNMDYDFAAFIADLAFLTHGNSYKGLVSIGGPASLKDIPPNPDGIDGVPLGLSEHLRFEGDNSILHEDFDVTGDVVSFSERKFEILKTYAKKYSTDPNHVDLKTMKEFKYQNFVESQKKNPKFQMTPLRIILTYNEAAFTTNLFRNGTTKQLSFETLTSFFKENTFPKNWFRQEKLFTFTDVVALNTEIFLAHPIQPGANDKYGKYVGYDYNFGDPCQLYAALLAQIPESLTYARGGHAKNVDFFSAGIWRPFSAECYRQLPTGGPKVKNVPPKSNGK